MHWIVLVGAFFIFWFLALQIVMPMGVKTPHEAGDRSWPAPTRRALQAQPRHKGAHD